MEFLSVAQIAESWGVSERSVRNYCAQGRVPGAFLAGKTWNIPADAKKPERSNPHLKAERPTRSNARSETEEPERANAHSGIRRPAEHNPLLTRLFEEKAGRIHGGIYHKLQVELTYNSNHIEGSHLSRDQTQLIFETSTIGMNSEILRVDDIIETANHFRCIDYCIDNACEPLSEALFKELHRMLKTGTSDSSLSWFAVGDYKRLPNEVGMRATTEPEEVPAKIRELLTGYSPESTHSLDQIIEFHVRFERIHPFQDGNGRVGRLIMLKECLANNIVPFVITDSMKAFYYRGLSEWNREKGFLTDTCLMAQDHFKEWLDYFRIPYADE